MSRTVASAITSTARVAALDVHPLKSAAGIRVDERALDERDGMRPTSRQLFAKISYAFQR